MSKDRIFGKHIKFEVSDISVGCLLLSEPFMLDAHFRRSAVLIADHHEQDGTMGFIINKPLDMKVKEVMDGFPEFSGDLYYGGPVQPETLHFVHSLGEQIEGTIEIAKGIFWGGDFDQVSELIAQGAVTPDQIRFFLGYSGWGEGQLADEIEENSWIIAPATVENVFDEEFETIWKRILHDMGDIFRIMANYPEEPQLN